MANTPTGVLLTERHRTQQLALNDATLATLRRLWRLFDPRQVDASWDRLGPLLETLVQARRQDSAALAAAYFEAIRRAETGVLTHPTIRLAGPDPNVADSLLFTGPITAKKLLGQGITDIAAPTFDWTAGNVTRLTLNGGRETLTASVQADRRTLGYARVTDGSPCHFCAMLAGRGAVYGRDSGAFKAHRRCGCTAEPVFSTDPALPGRADEFQALWTESTKGLSGDKARQAFRRAYEAQRT